MKNEKKEIKAVSYNRVGQLPGSEDPKTAQRQALAVEEYAARNPLSIIKQYESESLSSDISKRVKSALHAREFFVASLSPQTKKNITVLERVLEFCTHHHGGVGESAGILRHGLALLRSNKQVFDLNIAVSILDENTGEWEIEVTGSDAQRFNMKLLNMMKGPTTPIKLGQKKTFTSLVFR